ncbi:protein-lysine methyltransferase METTL21E-like isoform X1 [Anolis sagrei]|uniref:protein-lysine methyltransferase METTL21E-like isoform X1 n=2 Tax=Anolis sagrei TaxID=38937 RepID=UPI003521B196
MDSKSTQHKHLVSDELSRKTDHKEGQNGDEEIVAEIMGRCFSPSVITTQPWEEFTFAGHKIKIREGIDSYGAVVWPSALVLCHFLEKNVKSYNIDDKNVIEIGAGTGLVSIVASLLGARVIATDLPELIGNLQYNVLKNSKMKCKHEPQVKELFWGVDLEKNFPKSSCQFDYILAADVVYHHPYLEELFLTFDHLCKNNTVIIWAMRFRQEKENQFVDRFKKVFDLQVINDFPSLSITLFKAKRRCRPKWSPVTAP